MPTQKKMNLTEHVKYPNWINFSNEETDDEEKDVDGCRRTLSVSIGQRKVQRQQPPKQQQQQLLIDLGRDLRKTERMSRERDRERGKNNFAVVSHNEPHTHTLTHESFTPADYWLTKLNTSIPNTPTQAHVKSHYYSIEMVFAFTSSLLFWYRDKRATTPCKSSNQTINRANANHNSNNNKNSRRHTPSIVKHPANE